jgi:diguanylate cyclase (GGDEF)-like protein
MSGVETAPVDDVARSRGRSRARRRPIARIYEAGVALPTMAWILWIVLHDPHRLSDPMLLTWAVAIGAVDLMPIPASIDLRFSLSFPLQLAVALIYPTPVAVAVAFVGTSDAREYRREISIEKALFNRAQIALSVGLEALLFHASSSLNSPLYQLAPAVASATLVGYVMNAAAVAMDFHLERRQRIMSILRQMHVGIFGEFVLSYMGLALFGVLVATSFSKVGLWSIAVFVAPLAFARQMFLRTHSLRKATEELEIKQQEKEWQAMHDSLTGLPNRALFMQRLHEAIDEAAFTDTKVAVMVMDLNDFKEINDTLGHQYGDRLLEQMGPRLQGVLRDGDLIARLGGDEFGVVLPKLQDTGAAIEVAGRLLEALEQPLDLDGLAIDVSASIGLTIYPQHSESVETLLRRADVAMYSAKEARTGYEVYSPSKDRYSHRRLTLLSQVRPALENSEFVLWYQPKVNLLTRKAGGVEALIRWEHPEHGVVQPDQFIPMVERTVLMRSLTLYVLDEALRQWHSWARRGLDLSVAINLSPRNLLDLELPEQVARALRRWSVPAESLMLELTESSLMTDSVRAAAVLGRISAIGVKISVDDFGTGYSSLSHLKRLPINEIKIDRSFVTNMRNDPNDELIVRATVDLGRNLGLQVVAEGVEDRETWDLLAEMGCQLAQGYHMSRPLPGPEITDWLVRHDAARMEESLRQWQWRGEEQDALSRPRLRAL